MRFPFPTSPRTHEAFKRALAAALPGSFIEHVIVRHITGDHGQMLESFERIGR